MQELRNAWDAGRKIGEKLGQNHGADGGR